MKEEASIKARVERMRVLATDQQGIEQHQEACAIAQTVIHDTVGGAHPLMRLLQEAAKSGDWTRLLGANRGVLAAYDDGALPGPRLRIAHEIEGDLLEIAQAQVQLAESASATTPKQLSLAVAAFLAGAALEDALRRLCDASGLAYDPQRTTIAKLQSLLYQPASQIEIINTSETKQITAWGDTRNKADHGHFADLTQSEVSSLVVGVRAFIDRHLP